jgi:hypothetical protein
MAGLPWFKVYSNIVGHPKTRALEEATSNPEALAYIVRLLSWFNEYAPSGRADGARSARAAERACEWRGADGALVAALVETGWLERDGDVLVMHDWDEMQGSHIAKAKKDADRKKLHRLQSREGADGARSALKRRAVGAETARAEVADGARTARVEESRREEKRVEEISLPPSSPKGDGVKEETAALGSPDQQPLLTVVSSSPKPEDLQALWNRLAVPRGLGRWESMSTARRKAAQLALEACPDLGRWEAWLASELQNPFNLGENSSRWRADVDWFLRVKTRDKVRDFDPATAPRRPQGAQLGVYSGKDGTGDTLTYEDIHGVKRDEGEES